MAGTIDPGLIRGSAVTVLRPSPDGTDAHGNATVAYWAEERVDGVLCRPAGTKSLEAGRPEGVTADMRFSFPKGYAAPLRGCRVRYGGRDYEVVGDPAPIDSGLVPGRWNRVAEAVACDG